jgi:cation-transporting ATPase 13A1
MLPYFLDCLMWWLFDVATVKQADVGVALLSGFGDVNVDKGEDGNKKKELVKDSSGVLIDPSNNTTCLSPQDRQSARTIPLWNLKARLVALGVDLKKYPELTTEREDLIQVSGIHLSTFSEILLHEFS